MIPVFQTLFVAEHNTGNCMNACVASILEIPLEDCMDILPHQEGVWFLRWRRWFKERGFYLYFISPLKPPTGYSIVSVDTDRFYPEHHSKAGKNISHACVALDGDIVHDPFPNASNIYTITGFYEIVPIDGPDEDE